jgi:hypothetical protein
MLIKEFKWNAKNYHLKRHERKIKGKKQDQKNRKSKATDLNHIKNYFKYK